MRPASARTGGRPVETSTFTAYALVFKLGTQAVGDGLDQVSDGNGLQIKGNLAGLGAGELLQVVYQPLESGNFTLDAQERGGLRRQHAIHQPLP